MDSGDQNRPVSGALHFKEIELKATTHSLIEDILAIILRVKDLIEKLVLIIKKFKICSKASFLKALPTNEARTKAAPLIHSPPFTRLSRVAGAGPAGRRDAHFSALGRRPAASNFTNFASI
jgi:hypothetical protein